jgi:hypothetical protein
MFVWTGKNVEKTDTIVAKMDTELHQRRELFRIKTDWRNIKSSRSYVYCPTIPKKTTMLFAMLKRC